MIAISLIIIPELFADAKFKCCLSEQGAYSRKGEANDPGLCIIIFSDLFISMLLTP